MKKLKLLAALFKYQWQNEKAYAGDFIAGIFSTITYTATFLIFIFLLFQRIGSVAGYTRNDFLLLYFLQEITFFAVWAYIWDPLNEMVTKINTGQLVLVLSRPVPIKSWIQVSGMRPFGTFIQIIPPVLLTIFLVDWPSLQLSPERILASLFVWLTALVLAYAFFLTLTLPAFRYGEASDLMHILWAYEPTVQIYSRLPKIMRFSLFTIMPTVLGASATVAVLLGKVSIASVLIPAAITFTTCIFIQKRVWRAGLKGYTSASS